MKTTGPKKSQKNVQAQQTKWARADMKTTGPKITKVGPLRQTVGLNRSIYHRQILLTMYHIKVGAHRFAL